MICRCLIALLVIAMVAGCATRRDDRNKPAAASAAAQPAPAPAAEPAPPSSRRTLAQTTPSPKPGDYGVGGPLPGMEGGRKINEQDCRTGIDLLAGNLRCR